jgi:hypothetical protein
VLLTNYHQCGLVFAEAHSHGTNLLLLTAAAGHELKGLINFYKVHHFGICVPLMTIIGTAAVDYATWHTHQFTLYSPFPRLPRFQARGAGSAAHRR